jgi:hypothetical protein
MDDDDANELLDGINPYEDLGNDLAGNELLESCILFGTAIIFGLAFCTIEGWFDGQASPCEGLLSLDI